MTHRNNNGRYAHTNMDRMCACGHTLGKHAGGDGKGNRVCLWGTGLPGDENEPCQCGCTGFKAVRVKKA